ncbi:hypothetical protein ABE438_06740 [Bosea sp. TWI1241]|uniref:hypothetical protein n=1 Tax=Bosea sp. TWI1241 TaxID=3148904 RepID=UPI00320AA2C6
MHTIKVVAAGLVLLGAMVLLLPRLGLGGVQPVAFAARLFLPLWLLIALGNLWVGVSRAGYTVLQEVPFFLVVFGVPALAAGLLIWRAGR